MNAKKFSDLMLYSSGYKDRTKIENWGILEELYDKVQLYTQKEQRIPKIIHQIWLGSEVPTSLRQLMDSIQRVNLDYKYILWTDLEANKFDFKNKDLYNNCKNYGQKSDILRYAILNEFGGVYLDTDFVGCKSFDELLNLDFFTGVSYDKDPTMFNGLIGSTPGNAIITALNDIKEVRDGDGMEVIKSTGPWYLTDVVYNNIMNVERIAVMPLEYFYPYPNFNHDKVLGDDYTKYITEKTICVHLWHSRWN